MLNSSSWFVIFLAIILSSCSPFVTAILIDIDAEQIINKWEGRVDCAENGFFPADDLCTGNYVNCVDGVGYPEKCPGSTIFDPENLLCVPPSEASGSCLAPSSSTELTKTTTESTTMVTTTTSPETSTSSTTSTTRATRPTTACPTCPWECPDNEGFFAIPYYCGPDYYVCVEGSPYVLVCPNGTYFDPEILLCTDISTVSCIFRCPSPDGRFPVTPEECSNSFYDCIDNVPYPDKCPGTSIFDPVLFICVPSNIASCKQ